jgi:hypothetical protein
MRLNRLMTQAANLLSAGFIDEASRAWHSVLSMLLQKFVSGNVNGGKSANNENRLCLTGTFLVQPLLAGPLSELATRDNDDRIFTVFAHAFHYAPTTSASDHPLAVSQGTSVDDGDVGLVAMSLYNLGLRHHLRALFHEALGVSSFKYLENALHAYGAAQEILGANHFEAEPRTDSAEINVSGARLLSLALTNNQGHIYDRLHHVDRIQQSLDILHGILPPAVHVTEMLLPFLVTATLYPRHDKLSIHAASA